jgi:hypothetical protein
MNLIKSLGITRLFLVLSWIAVLAPSPTYALVVTPAMMQGRDFRGIGLAKFATHDYKLDRNMVYAVNFGLTNLVRAHQKSFGRQIPAGFVVRYRIFEHFSDYEEYALKKYRKKINPLMLAFYSPRGKEIVTWRQKEAWRLLPTLQHEGCHAIMDAMFGQILPFWMIEGSADWFGEAPAWLQKNEKGLLPVGEDQRKRWLRLEDMRRKRQLPDIQKYFLSEDYDEWKEMFKGDIGMGYDIGWSIFDFFIRSGYRGKEVHVDWPRQVLAEATQLAQLMPNRPPEFIFFQSVNAKWAKMRLKNGQQLSGMQTFERGWHSWIELNAREEMLKIRKGRKGSNSKP